MPKAGAQTRILTDFTGESYHIIFEESFATLTVYEHSLTGSMRKDEWLPWYESFKQHVNISHREILKLVD